MSDEDWRSAARNSALRWAKRVSRNRQNPVDAFQRKCFLFALEYEIEHHAKLQNDGVVKVLSESKEQLLHPQPAGPWDPKHPLHRDWLIRGGAHEQRQHGDLD